MVCAAVIVNNFFRIKKIDSAMLQIKQRMLINMIGSGINSISIKLSAFIIAIIH